jgi:hypothetical protein
VRRLHRLPDHLYQIISQCFEVGLIAKLGRESFQGLCGVVLPAVEAAIYKRLDAASQRKRTARGGNAN